MSKARLVITAVEIEGRTVADVVASYGVSRSWVYELLARYRSDGEVAFEPRSRRPHTSPTAISDHTTALIVELRMKLTDVGSTPAPTPSPGTSNTIIRRRSRSRRWHGP